MNDNDYLKDDNGPNYWMSMSDMMSGLLMIFILFLVSSLLQLSKQKVELSNTKAEIDRLMGVRESIVLELRDEFMDSNLDLKIDEKTGSITFSEGVFFDHNESTLKIKGEDYLKEFIPKYIGIILNEKNYSHISEVIIEGHTDDEGSYMYNLELSQKRAFEVVKFILAADKIQINDEKLTELKGILTANGKSFSNPVYDNNGDIDAGHSRRVEFKFRLKDEELIQNMEEVLNGK